jgi:hypothetical protein
VGFEVRESEKKAIEAARRFANLPQVESDAQVERVFAGLVDFRETSPTWIDPKTGRETRAASLVELYAELHRTVRQQFARLVASPRQQRREMQKEIAPVLAEGIATGYVFRKGRLELVHGFQSVREVCIFAFALILDERRGLTNRLHRCGWCGHFNLDLNPNGRPRRYCTPKHKELADAKRAPDRLREYRRRRESKK